MTIAEDTQLAPDLAGRRIVVGMSGGVDSSVAALRLQQHGCEVHGLFMFNWDEDEQGYCTAADDYQDARAVCERLGIPLHRVRFTAEYRAQVFADFLAGLAAGYTPNPDVLCNREIKFGHFLRHARRLGADFVATGHYARTRAVDAEHRLYRGLDSRKDQSYFLHAVSAAALGQSVFPLGELDKTAVRRLAHDAGLPNSRKRDSTGICFIGERPFREFLRQHLACEPGDICTRDGSVVGRHIGLPFYTLGQRQGLGIGGVRGYPDKPWYVAAKDARRNVLQVVQDRMDPALLTTRVATGAMHWINAAPPAELVCQVSCRYRQRPADARLTPREDGSCRIDFSQPQWAVTPGQYAVVYVGDRCLGGGPIARPGDGSAAETTV